MVNFRFDAVQRATAKEPIEAIAPSRETSDYYGCNVFNRAAMRKYLDADTRRTIYETIEKGATLDKAIADSVDAINASWLPRIEEAVARDINEAVEAQIWVLFGRGA